MVRAVAFLWLRRNRHIIRRFRHPSLGADCVATFIALAQSSDCNPRQCQRLLASDAAVQSGITAERHFMSAIVRLTDAPAPLLGVGGSKRFHHDLIEPTKQPRSYPRSRIGHRTRCPIDIELQEDVDCLLAWSIRCGW